MDLIGTLDILWAMKPTKAYFPGLMSMYPIKVAKSQKVFSIVVPFSKKLTKINVIQFFYSHNSLAIRPFGLIYWTKAL